MPNTNLKHYQTYLKDCDCRNSGIIIKDGEALCRWCRTPYGKGGSMLYEDEHFKQPKLDYEILSFIGKRGEHFILKVSDIPECYVVEDYTKPNSSFNIHSVKRLSDDLVYTIGDIVEGGKILCFSIDGGKFIAKCGEEIFNANHIYLRNLKKSKQILFTTTDGKDIYEGYEVFPVSNAYGCTKVIVESEWYEMSEKIKLHLAYFSTEDAANEFIIMNKPCLSYLDVMNTLPMIFPAYETENKLKKLVKQKLNG